MEKIRIGNDIDIHWSLVDESGLPYLLEGRDISIELTVGTKRVKIKEISVSRNTVHFVYYGKDQKYTGAYALKFIENDGEVDMVTFDTKDAFALVEHSWLAIDEGEEPERIQLEFITITSSLMEKVGPKGDRGYSAYEIAVQHGFIGTEEEWLDSLKASVVIDDEVIESSPNAVSGGAVFDSLRDKVGWDNVESEVFEGSDQVPNGNAVWLALQDHYTKDEVDNIIRNIEKFHYEVYPALPATGQSNVLYLIGPSGTGSDKYDEYVYTNNQFIKIGDTSIDLSNYATKGELAVKADKNEIVFEPSGVNGAKQRNGNNTASGQLSFANGYRNTASGLGAHAEGESASASGRGAHAEGYQTVASGQYAHASGIGTYANNWGETALGFYNAYLSGYPATIFSVGIGNSAIRRNAIDIRQDGEIYIYSVGGYEGIPDNPGLPLSEVLSVASNAEIDALFDEGGGGGSI